MYIYVEGIGKVYWAAGKNRCIHVNFEGKVAEAPLDTKETSSFIITNCGEVRDNLSSSPAYIPDFPKTVLAGFKHVAETEEIDLLVTYKKDTTHADASIESGDREQSDEYLGRIASLLEEGARHAPELDE